MCEVLSDWLDLDPRKLSQMLPKREHVSSIHVRYWGVNERVRVLGTCRWEDIGGTSQG